MYYCQVCGKKDVYGQKVQNHRMYRQLYAGYKQCNPCGQ